MAPDLKQIAALFNDCIDAIRNERHDNLEQLAAEWLRGARMEVMRKIEAECYMLLDSRGKPSSQKSWALDPSEPLSIYTSHHPPILRPFRPAIVNNLRTLMKDCGFNADVMTLSDDFYRIQIHFPLRITNSSPFPDTMVIDDQFSKEATTSGFLRLSAAVNEQRGWGQ